MEKKVGNLSPGAQFDYRGFKWTVLEQSDCGTLALASENVERRAFDEGNHNDWRKSSLRTYLNGAWVHGYEEDLWPILSDLISDDGMIEYGESGDYVALLSCDLYRKYRDIIPPVSEPYWTLTPYSCQASNSKLVRRVDTTGTLGNFYAYRECWGVRPLVNLKSDVLVSISEEDDRMHTTCSECGGEIGERAWWHNRSGTDGDYYCSESCIMKALDKIIMKALGIQERSNLEKDWE
jgi:hypothetical protein